MKPGPSPTGVSAAALVVAATASAVAVAVAVVAGAQVVVAAVGGQAAVVAAADAANRVGEAREVQGANQNLVSIFRAGLLRDVPLFLGSPWRGLPVWSGSPMVWSANRLQCPTFRNRVAGS
jgi:hypothetical protein